MQETRRLILEVLREHQSATVDELVTELRARRGEDITAVTVRHHLGILQSEGLVSICEVKHTAKPGRPQHIYALTKKAEAIFPNNYQQLAVHLLSQIEKVFPSQVNVILDSVAENMAKNASVSGSTLPERLQGAVAYLNDCGYSAYFEPTHQGYLLHTQHCPYHAIAGDHPALCQMDMRLISAMLGVVPRQITSISAGEKSCTYFVPENV